MIRECDELHRPLYPVKWEIIYCKGMKDKEYVSTFTNQELAIREYVKILDVLKSVPYSNIRFYATDKEGYSNCLLHISIEDN
jgi:hypothetical protein